MKYQNPFYIGFAMCSLFSVVFLQHWALALCYTVSIALLAFEHYLSQSQVNVLKRYDEELKSIKNKVDSLSLQKGLLR